MLERILPDAVAVSATHEDAVDVDLFPEEEEQIAKAVEGRRREFATARGCARTALAELGVAPVAIPTGPRGAPQWPAGIVGSITHCRGYRACAVARDSDLLTVGVDAEPDEPLPEGLLPDIALAPERRALAGLTASDPTVCWDRLLFCVKESVYKAWFPLTRAWLGFEDVTVSLDVPGGRFAARLLVPGPTAPGGAEITTFPGRWLVRDGLLLAAIAIPAEDDGQAAPGAAETPSREI